MKIYVQDNDWRGSIVVIASSKEKAKEIMKNQYSYDENREIDESEIEEGWMWADCGDC